MTDRVAWVTLTNGRKEYFELARPSWYEKMSGNIVDEVIIDTSGNQEYSRWLTNTYKSARIISLPYKSTSYSESVKFLLDSCLSLDCDYIIHLEDDYVLETEINLKDSIKILEDNAHVVQVHFIRQAWTQEEIDAGGVLKHCQTFGYDMNEKNNGLSCWVEHSAYFTFGPSIYRKEIVSNAWDIKNDPEREFTRTLIVNGNKTATFGKLDDDNMVKHIGQYTLGSK
jgi:hypothetical protein